MQLDKCILFQVHIYFESEIFIWMNEDYHLYIYIKNCYLDFLLIYLVIYYCFFSISCVYLNEWK